jgi:hypothetical protein
MELEQIEKLATKMCLLQGGHSPQFIVNGENDTAIVVINDLPDKNPEKMLAISHAAIETVVSKGKRIGMLKKIFFICEAWMSVVKQSGLKSFLSPSKDPKRIEALLISEFDIATNKETVVTFEMKRDKNKKLVGFEEAQRNTEDNLREFSLMDAFVRGYYLALAKLNEIANSSKNIEKKKPAIN